MTAPRVSILIPCYNAAPWLAAALDSALAQTWRHCEIIVVDDGSTDSSLTIAHSYRQRGVTVIAQPNRGASAARNAALSRASGDFIQYLDADDLLAPDKIERQLDCLRQERDDTVLISGEWLRFTHDPALAERQPDALWHDHEPVVWQTLALSGNLMMHPAAWLVSRRLSDAAGPWDETLTLNDDGEYFSRVRFCSRKIVFCGAARTYYRSQIPGSLSSPSSRRALDSAFRSHTLIHQRLLARENSAATRRACADAWMHFAIAAFPVTPDLARAATREAKQLGGSAVKPGGGRAFRIACAVVGWRRALSWRVGRRS